MERPFPSKDDATWQDAERERAFWQEHHDEFLHKYPDQFVAVRDGRVIATSYDLRDLIADLREQGLQPIDVWLHFFATATHAALMQPVGGGEVSVVKEAQPVPVQTTIRPLTDEEVERGRAALAASQAHIARMLAARGGEPFAPSWPLIREAREERERRL